MLQIENRLGVRNTASLKKYGAVYVGFFGMLMLSKLVSRGIWGVLQVSSLFFLLGGVVGMLVWLADRLVYVYYTRPEEELSVRIKDLVKGKKYLEAIMILVERKHEQVHLAMNNVMFLAVWTVLAFFLLTSSLSAFAKGLVLGIGLELMYSIWLDWKDKDYLMGRLFWPLKRKVSLDEMKIVLAVFAGLFLLASVMVV